MWAAILNFTLGLWLMASPAVMGYAGVARINDRIVGPVIAGIAFVAIWEVTRGLRWLNFLMGAWLVIAPMILLSYPLNAIINSYFVGLAVTTLSFAGGKVTGKMGGGWSALMERDSPE